MVFRKDVAWLLLSLFLIVGSFCGVGTANAQIIITVAGNGNNGSSGDLGPATNANLYFPWGVTTDGHGNIYIGDYFNGKVRKVDQNGVITTAAGGSQSAHFAGDGGPAVGAGIYGPNAVSFDGAGNWYIADSSNNRIRKVSLLGIITTVAGNGAANYSGDGGLATNATLRSPQSVVVDASNNLFIADSYNHRIRRVAANGIISTVAGNGTQGYSGDGGQASNAELNSPYGVALDASGNVYIADTENNRIRKVATNGTITTVAGNGTYFGDSTLGDGGPATDAIVSHPHGLTLDNLGNLYIASDCQIRKVTGGGTITTVAGDASTNRICGYSGDGGPATSASISVSGGVALDALGNLYIADTSNHRIRKVFLNVVFKNGFE